MDVVLVVDVANVVGARPDGWWHDRAGASTRVLDALAARVGRTLDLGTGPVTLARVVAVLEGRARTACVPAGVDVVLAAAGGDDAVVDVVRDVAASGGGTAPLVVTADRGLRQRLPEGTLVAGPGRLRDELGV